MHRSRASGLFVIILIASLPSCAHRQTHVASHGLPPGHAVEPPTARPAPHTAAGQTDASVTEPGASPVDAPAATHSEPSYHVRLIAYNGHSQEGPEALPVPPVVEPAPPGQELSEQASLPPTGALSLLELEQIALANNPTIRQAAAVVEKAQGIRTQVGLCPNPTIGYSAEEMGEDGTAGQQGGFLSQTIVTGGKLKLNRAVADQEIQNLLWELEAQRYRVRNAVRSRFYETIGAQRRIEIAEQLLQIARRGVESTEELLMAQQAARPDLLQARIQLNEVQILAQNARYEYEAAWKQLANVLGQPHLPPTTLAGKLDEEVSFHDPEAMLADLLAASPEIQAARARVARARAQIRRQEVQPIPNVLAQIGVAHDNSSGDQIASVQLGVPLPVFNRNQGNIQLAAAEYRRAVNDLQRLELALRSRLAAAFREYQKSRNQVTRYRDDILPTAEENLKLTEEGYRQGEFDLLRVLTARRSYFETNLAYVNSLVSLRQADVAITGLLLSGGLDDVPDAGGGNLQGVGLRDEALSGQ